GRTVVVQIATNRHLRNPKQGGGVFKM
ncbi:hypothetical protein EC60172_1139B, partial [Escherichia coli 6.0172]